MQLLRQLQLRLQYAKLKVDHGWQKQRLIEVENLYFRQQKQSDSTGKPNYPATALLSTPLDPQILAQKPQLDEAGHNSSLSFKLGSSQAPQPPFDAPAVMMDGASAYSMGLPTPSEQANGSSQWDMPPEAGPSTQTTPYPRHDSNTWTQQRLHDGAMYMPAIPTPIVPQGSPSSAALASFATQSPSLSQNPFPPPTTALSYDSFWSSHSDSATGQMGGPVPAASFAPAPMFTPKNGKGKGRVNGGSVVKRKSPVTRIEGPG
ncbi:hypothetical protein B0H19DRAFT_1158567 [Mycena capillaripes]|nr:hypothetical protein B0H19DRAFT_1158567 [Mycena capillaripes]